MHFLFDLAGYTASALVLLTFITTDMRLLRIVAILSNVAFIVYAAIGGLAPVLVLHALLLPVNVVRLRELCRASDRPLSADVHRLLQGARPRIALVFDLLAAAGLNLPPRQRDQQA
jgi:hypothetical protein